MKNQKKRKNELTEPRRRKKNGEERKKKRSKGAADLTSRFLHVCLITKMSLKTELSKLKTTKMCFQFP